MKDRIRHGRYAFIVPALIVLAGLTAAAEAQTSPPTAAEDAYIAAITRDDVYIRSGAHHSYYPFGILKAGTLVRVTMERDNWASVECVGPGFDEMYGYLRYREGDAGHLRIDADGRRAMTLGRLDVLAPNLKSNGNPVHSWKAIARIEPDTEITILETTPVDGDLVQRIALPTHAKGWISLANLRRADEEEQIRFKSLMLVRHRGERGAAADRPSTTGDVMGRDETVAPPVVDPVELPPLGTETILVQDDAPMETVETDAVEVTTADDPIATDVPAAPAAPVDERTLEPAPLPDVPDVPEALPPVAGPVAALDADPETALANLEYAYEELRRQQIETAEVQPLRGLYMDLSARSGTPAAIVRYADARAEQLQIWAELQERRTELNRIRNRAREASAEARTVREAMERSTNYVAVGRLGVSNIYDGERLPRLLRVQDPTTGRTVAYVRPTDYEELSTMIDQLIGIVGSKTYDGRLRVNLVVPERIEILSPRS